MTQPEGHHLAEFNLGILKYDWDDPRVQDFVDGLDLVNNAAMRSPGFVWMMDGETMEREQNDPHGPLGGDPRTASTLSVWKDVASLEHFVWNTVHKRFYDRKHEWYDMGAVLRLVMWWVPIGHRPDMVEAMERFRRLDAHGPSDQAFGWDHVKDAQLWKAKACG
ncbi:DUF3291 domain-containing protein [Marimonas sp. MJW-29]|uniref:DUF3291 domain-containing protein n=1 Tax=Sulfitobacter sediminis TaxID=3234186 RepID=A0ABV3RJM4_9RHOB